MGFGFIHFKLQQFSKWFDHSIPVSNVPNLSNENVVHSVLFCFSVFHYRKLLIGTLSKRILSNPMNWSECRIQHKIHTYMSVVFQSIFWISISMTKSFMRIKWFMLPWTLIAQYNTVSDCNNLNRLNSHLDGYWLKELGSIWLRFQFEFDILISFCYHFYQWCYRKSRLNW